jgi:site-specific DNA-methyltransferase (adenine-specific)
MLGIRPVADFETLNYQIMTDLNTSTEATITDETAIGFIPCYRLPFLRQKDVEVWNESNLETMKNMPENHIDLTVTSPPYDGLRDYNGYSFPFEEIAKELFRVTKDGGVVVWVVGDATINGSETGTSFRQALYFMKCGFNLHDTMIYHKNTLPLTHNRYEQQFEYMFIFCKGKPKTFNAIKVKSKRAGETRAGSSFRHEGNETGKLHTMGNVLNEKYMGNVWFYETGFNKSTSDEIAFEHPAIFPEQLAADHIYSWSNEGDLVYDCFGGSGTTVKMAHKWKRKSIMSEISLEYCQIAKNRIEPYLMQECLF